MTSTIWERRLRFGFFLSINRTDDEWIHNDKVVRFGVHFGRDRKANAWFVGVITEKLYSLFGHIS